MKLSATDVRKHFRRVDRAHFERWPEDVADRIALIRREWRRSRARRERFIGSPAFGRVLDALSNDAASELAVRWLRGHAPPPPHCVATAARIAALLLWIQAHRSPLPKLGSDWEKILEGRGINADLHRRLLDKHDPAEVLRSRTDYLERRRLQTDLRKLSAVSPTAGARQLEEAASLLTDPTEHLWAEPIVRSRAEVGQRGRAAADRASAWRGVFVRALDTLVPERCQRRNATIAELLQLTGDNEIERRHVTRILKRPA